MSDHQRGQMIFIDDCFCRIQDFCRSFRIKRGGMLVEKQQLRVGGERACYLELSLLAVGEVRCKLLRLSVKLEHLEQLQSLCGYALLLLEVAGESQCAFYRGVVRVVMKSRLYVVENAHVLEQADILEGSCDTSLVDSYRRLSGDVFAVQEDSSRRRLVHSGQHVEHGGFSGAVRSDKTVELPPADSHVQTVYRAQTSELYREVLDLENVVSLSHCPHLPLYSSCV